MAGSPGLAKQRRALTKLWLAWRLPLAVLVVAFVLLGGGYYAYLSYVESSAEAARQLKEKTSREVVQRFSSVIRAQLDAVHEAIDLERAAELLATGDEAARSEFAAAIAAARPEILGVRLLDADVSEVNYDSTPPVSYATLDQLRRTRETGKQQPAEVHFYGDERQHIALVVPVPGNDGALAGFVLLGLDVGLLKSAEKAAAPPPGAALQVQQTVPGAKSLTLATVGGARSDPPTLGMKVRGTIWRLRYWAPPDAAGGGVDSESSLPLPLLAGAVVVVLLLGAGVVVLRRRRQRPSSGQPSAAGEGTAESNMDDLLSEKLAALSAAVDSGAPPAPPDLEVHDGAVESTASDTAETPVGEVPESIFRAYDIRGVVGKTLTVDGARSIGRAIGSEVYECSQQTVVVGYDGRTSSPELATALIEGLRASGRDVIDIGRVSTPVLYFATHHLETGCGVVVTGSHNPPEYNGFKVVIDGETLYGERIAALRGRIRNNEFTSGEGTLQQMDVTGDYIRRVAEDIPVALGSAYKIVVDCGNGIAGELAPKLLRGLGHDVIELYCEVDGSFPNHHPDPSRPENLADLVRAVKKNNADIGFAFDGDGDRLGIIDGAGRVLWPDRQMMLYARDVLSRNPGGTIVFDVKCSSRLARVIDKLGGRPVMWKTGHSLIKAKMKETKAVLGGEMSGHIFFKDRWYGFDDAFYAAARMVEILMAIGRPPAQVFDKLPTGIATPELRIDLDEGEPARFMNELLQGDRFPGAEVNTIDGLRADYPDGWGLVRASNTTPSLVLRFEADNKEALERIENEFRQALLEVDAGMAFPF